MSNTGKTNITLNNLYDNLCVVDALKAPTSSSSSVPWNDDYLVKEYANNVRFKSRPTPSQGITYAKSFLNWYVYNILPASVEDTILGLLGSIPLSETGYLISDHFFNSEIVTVLSNPGDISPSTDGVWRTTCQGVIVPGDKQSASGTGVQPSTSQAAISITIENAKTWYDALWGMLNKTPVDNVYPPEVYSGMVYIGYICLQMLRVCVKEKNSVSIHIMKYTNDRVNKLFTYKNDLTFTVPPHDGMMEKFQSMFVRFQPGSVRALTFIVYSHIHPSSENKDLVEAIFRSAGLLALSQVGLGCLGWLSWASEKNKVPMSQILKYMAITKHENMILSILQFVDTIGDKSSEKSWPWARLFTDGAFQELSVRRDSMFGMIMMVVTTGAALDDVMWDIDQFKNYSGIPEVRKAAHDYGHFILHCIMKVSPESCNTTEAKMVIENLSNIPTVQ